MRNNMFWIFTAGVIAAATTGIGAQPATATPAQKQETAAATKSPKGGPAPSQDTLTKVAASAAVIDSTAQRSFTLRIVTTPDSAQVYLNDSLVGMSPCSLVNVPAGTHELTLKKVGCYLKKAQIVVDSGAPLEYSFALLQPAFLRIESEPAGAEVAIDGNKAGVTPYESDKVKPGEYTVRMELATYRPVERKITVASAGHDTVRTVLVHTEAYLDSLNAAKVAEARIKKERFNGMLASALFAVGAVVIVVLELLND